MRGDSQIKIDFKDLIEAVPIGISITTPEGETIECNSNAYKILGYNSKEEFLEAPVLSHYFNPKDREKFFELAEKGIVENFEVQLKKQDSSVIWVSISSKVRKIDGNTFYFNSFQDITERKKVEQNLKESEEKFRSIAEQSFMSIVIIQDGLFKYFNERVTKINGYSAEEIRNWKPNEFRKIIHPEDRKFVLEQAKKKQKGNKDIVNQYKYRLVRKDGEIRWMEIYSKTILYKGKPADLAMTIDITDKIKTEHELKESEEKYREAYNRADFYKDLFAHDMSNILQNIKSSMELSQMWLDDPEKKDEIDQMYDIINEQINRGSSLILNVRKLSSIDNGTIEKKPINLQKMLNDAIENVHTRFPPNDFIIEIGSFDESSMVLASELLIDVFENILINAAIHNKNKPKKLEIQITKTKDKNKKYIRIEHKDNGAGIEDEMKDLIFSKSSKTEKSTGGMGIGLSLIKKIIDSYEGKIWVEDRVKGDYSKGSNFILLLKES